MLKICATTRVIGSAEVLKWLNVPRTACAVTAATSANAMTANNVSNTEPSLRALVIVLSNHQSVPEYTPNARTNVSGFNQIGSPSNVVVDEDPGRGHQDEPEHESGVDQQWAMPVREHAAAGVPLTRVHELIGATLEQFATAIEEIDQTLTRQIEELRRRKLGVAALQAGDRMFLPAEISGYLDELRALGVNEHGVRFDRDGWIVLAAACPDRALTWIAQKREQLADPDFRQSHITYDQAHDWDPRDPRLDEPADVMAARLRRKAAQTVHEVLSADEQSLLGAHVRDYSQAWIRLNELGRQRTTS